MAHVRNTTHCGVCGDSLDAMPILSAFGRSIICHSPDNIHTTAHLYTRILWLGYSLYYSSAAVVVLV